MTQIAPQPDPTNEPILPGQRRRLAIRPERIDPALLADGRAPEVWAEYAFAGRAGWGDHRHFTLDGLRRATRVQLNRGQPRKDEARLTAIAEELLAPAPPPLEVRS